MHPQAFRLNKAQASETARMLLNSIPIILGASMSLIFQHIKTWAKVSVWISAAALAILMYGAAMLLLVSQKRSHG